MTHLLSAQETVVMDMMCTSEYHLILLWILCELGPQTFTFSLLFAPPLIFISRSCHNQTSPNAFSLRLRAVKLYCGLS